MPRASGVRAMLPALWLAALAAGCGGGDAPTGPAPAPTAERTTLTIDFSYIEVLEDCDGIEGDGEFEFAVATGSVDFRLDVVYKQSLTLGPGGRSDPIGRRTYTIDAIDGKENLVQFGASELDRNILGEEYDDSRLDHAYAEKAHVFRNGTWSNLGPQSITLGSAGCRVRLYYSAEGS